MNLYFFAFFGGFKGGREAPLSAPPPLAFARVRPEAILPALPRWKKDTWRTTK